MGCPLITPTKSGPLGPVFYGRGFMSVMSGFGGAVDGPPREHRTAAGRAKVRHPDATRGAVRQGAATRCGPLQGPER